jgi:hypothetical protein
MEKESTILTQVPVFGLSSSQLTVTFGAGGDFFEGHRLAWKKAWAKPGWVIERAIARNDMFGSRL